MDIQRVEQYCKDTTGLLIKEYESVGRKASGNWANDLDYKITDNNGVVVVEFLGSHYTVEMENGRKPNAKQDSKSLRSFAGWMANKNDGLINQWCKDKNINTKFAFPIAYNLGKKGYKGLNFIDSVIERSNTEQLAKDLLGAEVIKVQTELKRDFKKWQSKT
ncbi:MAG: hypothetical protein OEL54_03040 [Flavobacteriaceae bacterium]|nr:hypothetical protein [Flavobacteriaceae bacterium]